MNKIVMSWEGHGIRMRLVRTDQAIVRLERCHQDAMGGDSWRTVAGDMSSPIRDITDSLTAAFEKGQVSGGET